MVAILARVCTSLVTIPACAPVRETACLPKPEMAIAVRAIVVCSPVDSSTSISRSVGLGETSRASLMSPSVTPLIADTTTTTLCPASCVSMTRRATFTMRSGLPTEVPPYFCTISAMGKGVGSIRQPSRRGKLI
jgi:hypothetical protein